MGIEPTSEAWEASILPLYDARLFLTVGSLYLTTDRLVQLQKTQHSALGHFLSSKVLGLPSTLAMRPARTTA